ncbi:MAG: DUF1028 domain-containing protein [Proteobacteria bacterium]|nr:DUF1028 domain-containing protein [Pseudomonadota bacterium]MDA1355105.1 DUF1028 domain-containing protein [Pseudomonadota bacterium]
MALNLTTFSISARDPHDGTLGVAVSTKVPAVGSLCPFVRFGAGAVSTQAWVNPSLGPLILDRMARGESADQALDHVISEETDAELRQLGVVDVNGGSAAFTGRDTDGWSGHRTGADYSVQGNMLVGEDTLAAMERVFLCATAPTLGERLLMALEAGQAAGGDRRGRQSAAVIVRGPEVFPLVDLRVDEHPDPVKELRRIFEVAKIELFPFVKALPSSQNPRGDFAAVRATMAPKD